MVKVVGEIKYRVVFDRMVGLYMWHRLPESVQNSR